MDGIDNCVESFVGVLDSVCEPLFEKILPTFNSDIPQKMIQMSYIMRNVKLKKKHKFSPALTVTEIVGMMKIGLKW